MANLSKQFNWLNSEPGPKMILEALKLYDTKEALGQVNNPVILSWAKEIGGDVEDMYLADAIPWCGLFMAIVAKRAGKELPKSPLWALSWGTFGKSSPKPMLGDTLTFIRRAADGRRAGHVALYVGEDDNNFYTLGGNQADCVCITKMAKNRLYAARRPIYTNQPANIRSIFLKVAMSQSTNEQ